MMYGESVFIKFNVGRRIEIFGKNELKFRLYFVINSMILVNCMESIWDVEFVRGKLKLRV